MDLKREQREQEILDSFPALRLGDMEGQWG